MNADHESVRVGVCRRDNADQRSYKVLMNVAGDSREFAIQPKELRAAARALVVRLACSRVPDYVVGFAPGGIAVAVAVAEELSVPAVIAYKTQLGLPDEVTWSEPHCFNNTFYFYGAAAGDTVLLVDDEVDNGNTIANAATALRARSVEILGVGAAVEVTHASVSHGRQRLAELGLDLRAVRTVEVDG